jgi:hypothetical protein
VGIGEMMEGLRIENRIDMTIDKWKDIVDGVGRCCELYK